MKTVNKDIVTKQLNQEQADLCSETNPVFVDEAGEYCIRWGVSSRHDCEDAGAETCIRYGVRMDQNEDE